MTHADKRLLILQDSRLRPALFHWFGPIARADLQLWLKAQRLDACPVELVRLWEETGGGDVFESETILGPSGDPELGDAVGPVNDDLRSRGLPERLTVFHTGMTTSAIDIANRDYVELDSRDFRPLRRFASLDEWYAATIREEYAGRYGLPLLPRAPS